MKKRLLAIFLCIAMIASLVPTVALAAGDTGDLVDAAMTAVQAQTAAAAAFKAEMEEFRADMETDLKAPAQTALSAFSTNIGTITGEWEDAPAAAGTDYTYDLVANTLHIYTAEGLAWMMRELNAGRLAGTAVFLEDDIDLTGKLWTPADLFTGTFDGQDHTITGLTINVGTQIDAGLFYNITGTEEARSYVRNVTFDNVNMVADDSGVVAYRSDYTDYSNITVTGTLLLYTDETAGIVYDSSYDSSRGCVFDNCDLVNVTAYANQDFYGITYNAYNDPTISNCDVGGSFYVGDEFAGIAYYAYYGAEILDCNVSGDAYSCNDIYGLFYELENNEYDEGDGNGRNIVSGCSVSLNACTEDDLFGLAYEMEDDSVVQDCTVSGTYYSGYYFYGIAEYIYDGGEVIDCSVSGKAYAEEDGAAGFYEVCGSSDDGLKAAVISELEVDLTAYYDAGQAGGLILETYGNVNISDCTVAGAVYSCYDDHFGGIVSEACTGSYTERVYATGSHRNGYSGRYCDTTDHPVNGSSYHNGRYYSNARISFGNLTVENCKVTASIWRGGEADSANGGIIGYAEVDELTVSGCEVTGGLYFASEYLDAVGGLIGQADPCDDAVRVLNSRVDCDILVCAEEIGFNYGLGGLIGGGTGSPSSVVVDGCSFTGNLIAKALSGRLNMYRIGAFAANLSGSSSAIRNCSAESQIILDASEAGAGGSVYHGGAMLGGWKYPDRGEMENCTFTGDVTYLGNADDLFDVSHFGMIVGENCADITVMNNVTVNGNFYADYAGEFSYLGGAVGHRCCDDDFTGSNIVVNTDFVLTNTGDMGRSYFGGFIGDCGDNPLKLTDCEYNGDITVEMIPPEDGGSYNGLNVIGGFLGGNTGETELVNCSHTGSISVSEAALGKLGGFYGSVDETDAIRATDSYTFGDITIDGGEIGTVSDFEFGYTAGIGQWVSIADVEDMYTKNCYSVGNITINADYISDSCYIGSCYGYAETDGFTMDNFYYAGTVNVSCTTGEPHVGYISGTIDGPAPILINVYYDEELYAASQVNGSPVPFEGGQYNAIYLSKFVPLSTLQMQANRYETDESYRSLDGSPAVAEPGWDYLNGAEYAEEAGYKTPLVDALNAGKDGYLNWVVDGESFRGYPYFGQSWTILYYVDFGSGYELQHIEQFTQKGITAQEIPVPDQTLYPNSAYEWQDQNGVTFTEKTRLFGDKFVYADLVSYYTVQYIANYPDDLAVTPSDNDILENGYISGATVTVRSNNTFTVPEGYRFREWNTAADGSGESVEAFATQQITDRNLVFYAIWEPLPQPTYSVCYVANGGSGDMWDAHEYKAGETVTVKANEFVHPEGLIFDGFLEYESGSLYSADDDDSTNDTFRIQRDTYLIAQWIAPTPTCSVTYMANGGEGTMTDDTAYKAGEDAPVLENTFTREGWEFDGFVDLDNNRFNGDGTETFTITKDTVLIAQWTPARYSVTYHGNGAAEQDVVDSGYVYGTPVTVRDGEFTFTKEGSRFLYWSLTADGEKEYDAYDTIEITGDIELYAIWEELQPEQTYSVTYKGNGAVEQDYIDDGYAEGSTAVIKNGSLFTRSGYTFLHWSLTEDGEEAYSAYDRVVMTEDITLYAIWKQEAANPGGGMGGNSGSGTVNIIKVDSNDRSTYLAGAKFMLYTGSGDLVGTYTTNGDGQITVGDLASGSYYAVETTPPSGYTLDPSRHEFTVASGETTVLTVTNERTSVPPMLNGDDHFAYIIGRSDGLVHPEAYITRAEVTTIFFRLLDPEVREENLTAVNTFTDVNAGMWFNTAVSTMTKLGIVNGRSSTTFDPNACITRAEFAAIAARFDDSTVSELADFRDIGGHWARFEISKAAANGWVNGYSDGTFKPNQNITRAEAMAFINRVLNRAPENTDDLLSDMVRWPDNMNTTAWYYLDVQEATNSHDYVRKDNGCETWTELTEVPDWSAYEK